LIAASSKIIVYPLRVDIATIAEYSTLLLTIKGDVTIVGYRPTGSRVTVEEALHRLSFR
jgi:hypothetical protein